jgi:predicted nucleic acid-binding protein
LPDLFGRVIIPEAVFQELQDEKTPDEVRGWIASHPAWLELQAVRTPLDAELLQLHKGEAEAIALAQELNATVLIIDEKEGREIAVRRGIPITGLLILCNLSYFIFDVLSLNLLVMLVELVPRCSD